MNQVNKPIAFEKAYKAEIEGHRDWLTDIGDDDRASRWEQLLRFQPEPAVIEACVRFILAQQVNRIEAAEDLSSGGPDFRCIVGDSHFYAECACMTVAMVTAETTLPDAPGGRSSYFRDLTVSFLRRCREKERQCGVLTDAPCLLAIGTVHTLATALCFNEGSAERTLTSRTLISCRMDVATGDIVGDPRADTDLRFASFLRPGATTDHLVEPMRRDISGLLLCGFGGLPYRIHGVLHPDPLRPFDRTLLPQIPFCRLAEQLDSGDLVVEWV